MEIFNQIILGVAIGFGTRELVDYLRKKYKKK